MTSAVRAKEDVMSKLLLSRFNISSGERRSTDNSEAIKSSRGVVISSAQPVEYVLHMTGTSSRCAWFEWRDRNCKRHSSHEQWTFNTRVARTAPLHSLKLFIVVLQEQFRSLSWSNSTPINFCFQGLIELNWVSESPIKTSPAMSLSITYFPFRVIFWAIKEAMHQAPSDSKYLQLLVKGYRDMLQFVGKKV